MNDILEHRKAIMNNIAKSFVENSEDNLEKARSGIYTDNAENKQLKILMSYVNTKK